ncbi:MAG: hypothetical protein K1X36_09620 [Pyrinomonadaceae bacterium]|nr:hypothetical protein [Pyrinomonadaceae bacterium]
MGFWGFVFVLVGFAGLRYLSWYRSKDLPSPNKELTRIRFAILLIGIMFLPIFLSNWPSLSFYIPTFDGEIETIQDAQKALVEQNEILKKLAEAIQSYNFYTFLLVAVLIGDVLPALYCFSAALVPGERIDDDIEDDKIISIFEEDKKYGK